MPVNPSGKTWDLINEGNGQGSTDNVIGGGGGGPVDPLTLPLINGWDTNVFTLGGGFKVSNGLGVDFHNIPLMPISMSSGGGMWVASGVNADPYDFHVIELSIPTLSTNPVAENLNAATAIRARLNVQSSSETGVRYPDPSNGSHPRGVYEYNGSLICVNYHAYYNENVAKNGDFKDILLVVDDVANLETSTVSGYIDIDCDWYGMGWMGEVPTDWQSILGHTHFCGATHVLSRNGRSSKGPSFYGVDLNDIITADANFTANSTDIVSTERFMSFTAPTKHAATAVNPAYNNLVSSSNGDAGPFDGNDIYNHLTRGNGGFIIPGTRTYLCIMGGGGMGPAPVTGLGSWVVYENGGTVFKLDGSTTVDSGYHSLYVYDYYPHYIMYDVADFVDVKNGVKNPDEVAPYAWGRIPESYFPWMINPITTRDNIKNVFMLTGPSSCLDSSNNRFFLQQRRGHFPNGNPSGNNYPVIWSIDYDISGL